MFRHEIFPRIAPNINIIAKAKPTEIWSAEVIGNRPLVERKKGNKQIAPVKQYGSRLVMKEFAPFFDAFKKGELVADLRTIYNEMKTLFPDITKISKNII